MDALSLPARRMHALSGIIFFACCRWCLL